MIPFLPQNPNLKNTNNPMWDRSTYTACQEVERPGPESAIQRNEDDAQAKVL